MTSLDSVVTATYLANLRAIGVLIPTTEPEKPCYLLRLPSELRFDIVEHLDSKRDLYNLSRTCKALEDVTLRRLYRKVDIEIPEDRSQAWNSGGYLTLRPLVVKVLQELNIRNGILDYRQPQYNRRRRSDASSSEAYAAQIVDQIPKDQLNKFSFMHKTPLSMRLLNLLFLQQNGSLRDLRFYELQPMSDGFFRTPTNLKALECRTIDDGNAIGRILATNRNIERLVLGQEKELLQQYSASRAAYLDQSIEPLHNITNIANISFLPSLRELSLCGLDVTSLIPTDLEAAMFFGNLTSLTLESCNGSAGLLTSIAQLFTFLSTPAAQPARSPSLTTFKFRHEALTGTLKNALIALLNSFTTLTHLSLLIENGTLLTSLSNLIRPHGPTLHTLALESRVQPRELLRFDTSRPFGMGGYSSEMWETAMSDICTFCPSLVELSIGFPWKDEMVRLRHARLPMLRHLRTMHIRNFPESSTHLQMGDYTILEHAQKFTRWNYSSPLPQDSAHALSTIPSLAQMGPHQKPALETLSIGPPLYETRYKGTNPTRSTTPEFLRTHHFAVDWGMTRFGKWSALVSPVSERYMEELREEKPLGGVFEQVWLR